MRYRGDIRPLSLGTLLLAAMVVCSCQSARTDRYRASFLPASRIPASPTPDPEATAAIGEAPPLNPRLFIADTPAVFRTSLHAERPPSPLEIALQLAESHFSAGKAHYQFVQLVP